MSGPSIAGRRALASVLLSLVAIGLVVRLGRESTLWMDELYTLALVHRQPARILDLTAIDFNPPGYYLSLKAWLKVTRAVGFEPGTLWARSLAGLPWLLAIVLACRLRERRRRPCDDGLLPLAVAGGAAMIEMARHLRGYAVATPALTVAWLALLCLGARRQAPQRRDLGLWLLYVGSCLVAIWSHALSLVVTALLATVWALLAATERQPRRQWRAGIVAHALIAGGALPWMIPAVRQLGRLQAVDPDWMTPSSAGNLLRVFTLWLPFGGLGATPGQAGLLLLGALSLLVPLVLGLTALRRRVADTDGYGLRAGLLGMLATAAFVTALWLAARWELAELFHGPRYPLLAAGIWGASLVAVARSALERLGRPATLAWLALAPWLACAAIGQWTSLGHRGPAGSLERLDLPANARLYVMPSELRPFVRRSLAEHQPLPIDELPEAAGAAPIAVLELNRWRAIDRERDLMARHWIDGGRLATTVSSRRFPTGSREFRLTILPELDPDGLAELRSRQLRPTTRAPASAVSIADAEDQRYGDGWSFLEVADDLGLRRWSDREVATLRFDRAVDRGPHCLAIDGYRTDQPTRVAEVEVDLAGAHQPHRVSLQPGRARLRLEVEIDRRRKPTMTLRHPLWSPTDLGSSDPRRLGFQLRSAWLLPGACDEQRP